VTISWHTWRPGFNGTDVTSELLVFYDGPSAATPCNCAELQRPDFVVMETNVSKQRRRHRRDLLPSLLSSSSSSSSPSSSAAAAAATVVDMSSSESSCRVHRWYLDFARLGWTQWVRYPTGYYANYCDGACTVSPPGTIADNSTIMSNHAFVKALYLAASNGSTEDGPRSPAACCVSLRLSPINILYNNDDGQWVLTEMAEMTADECGCL